MLTSDFPDFITEELADETSNALDELFGNPHGTPSIYSISQLADGPELRLDLRTDTIARLGRSHI